MVRGILEDFANSEASIDLDRDSSPRLLFAIHRIAFEGDVMRWLGLMGIALFCTGCHHTANRGGPMGFGMLGSNPGNGVASAPPVYATPPQYVQVQQPASVAAAPQQVVAAPAPQPIVVQQAPVAVQPQVVQQAPVAVQPAAYYQSNACQPACPPVCQPVCCQ